jgi:hypothetical protein
MSRLGCKKIACCLTVLGAAFFGFILSPHARTWHVKQDGSGDALTIQAAVDSSASGDSILVAAGRYFDSKEILVEGVMKRVNVHLYKNVRIIGEGGADKTMIKGYSSDIAVYIDDVDSTAELSHFIIETSWGGYTCTDTSWIDSSTMPAAIDARNSAALISGNLIRYNDVGIRLKGSSASITNNEIHHSVVSIFCGEESGAVISYNELHDGLCLINCDRSSPAIDRNDLRKACIGVHTGNGASPFITNNLIHFIWSWAVACNSGPVIEANQFTGNASAVHVAGGEGIPIVRYNMFFQNIFAVEIALSNQALIGNNTFDACEFAVYCAGDVEAAISRNVIVRPGIGISCNAPCSLAVDCNNIFDALIARYDGSCTDRTGIDGNISIDPEFCGIEGSGNYYLQSDSPCAPGNHPLGTDCGRIGAFPVNCETVPVADKSWGAIKNLFSK